MTQQLADSSHVAISYTDAGNIIRERISNDIKNTTLCAKMGRDEVRVYQSSVIKAFDGEPLYGLVPKKAFKTGSGWFYDMSEFSIYKIDKDFLSDQGIHSKNVDLSTNSAGMVSIYLKSSAIVYSSNDGLIEVNDSVAQFSLREQACLHLQIPESGTKWLDDLITIKNESSKKEKK